jgi:hypothetical protein
MHMQVREFDIVDACPYSLELEWDKDGTMTKQHIFEATSPFPNSKMLTLLRSKVCACEWQCRTKLAQLVAAHSHVHA